MKTSSMKQSKFLTKDDAGVGILVTIVDLKEENVEMEGKPEKLKWVCYFTECKPLVLNATNIASIERVLGDETDNWMGKKIVLFNDENVSFGGEITGGVRVDLNRTKRYHAKQEKDPIAPPKSQAFDDFKDDRPWDDDKTPF